MTYDLAIIGAGINGAGVAADAALRGLSVFLCDQADIASHTSSKSSQLIHGGLRYLAQYDLPLVKKALDEQQILLNIAPHLVHPMPFFLPHDPSAHPQWMLRTGLFLYDHLSSSNTLPTTKHLNREHTPHYFEPLVQDFHEGFLYYDCQTNDARLTLSNALLAHQHQATIKTHTKLIEAKVVDNHWHLTLIANNQETYTIEAKALVNAAGPFVEDVNHLLNIPQAYSIRLIKGSHLVVHKLYEGEHAYMLQDEKERIIFVIPFHGYSLIGTTDVPYAGDLDTLAITPEEIAYLSQVLAHSFQKPLKQSDIVASWSGVRTLITEEEATTQRPSTLSRDYKIVYQDKPAPAITLYGGKITTYRQLACEAIDKLREVFPHLPNSKTATTALPGAISTQHESFKIYAQRAEETYHWLDSNLLQHYLKTYGTLTEIILKNCHQPSDLGLCFTPLLYQIEVDYLLQHEWATSAEDILWRRTKLGLDMDMESHFKLLSYMASS